jgi:hypothetical protein
MMSISWGILRIVRQGAIRGFLVFEQAYDGQLTPAYFTVSPGPKCRGALFENVAGSSLLRMSE